MPALRVTAARWLDGNLSASTRLLVGLLLAAGLVAQDDLMLRGAQALIFAALAWLVQPRLRLRRTMLFLGVTVAFNLLTPAGRVLLRIGGVAVTEGALTVGAGKAASLGGLMFLSRLMVDSRLRLPGAAGALLASSLAFLARLVDGPCAFRPAPSCPEPRPGIALRAGRRARSATGRRRFRHDDSAGRDVRGRAACARRRSARLEPPPRLTGDGVRLRYTEPEASGMVPGARAADGLRTS